MLEIRPVDTRIIESCGEFWLVRRYMTEFSYDPEYVHFLAGPFDSYEAAVSATRQVPEYNRGSWWRTGGTPPVDLRPIIDFHARAVRRWQDAAPKTPEQLARMTCPRA